MADPSTARRYSGESEGDAEGAEAKGGEEAMKPLDAANLTMGIGVTVIAYGSLGFFMGAGVTSLDPTPIGIGVVILLVGAVWRFRIKR